MSDQKVKRIATYLTEDELRHAFLQSWKTLFKTEPTAKQISILLAQNALETNHSKNMYNFNIGNITHSKGDGFNYFQFDHPLMEQVSKGNWKAQEMKFRSYPTLDDGVRDYLLNLRKRGNGSVWAQVQKEDPAAFSKALKQTGYYTANEEDTVDPKTGKTQRGYTSNIVELANKFNASNQTPVAIHGNSGTISELIELWKKLVG